jgi:hypothetical protein
MDRTSPTRRSTLRLLGAAAALACGAAAPVAFADRGRFVGETVVVAPPPPRPEPIGEAPHPGWVYEKGWWDWHRGKHVWVPGHWKAPRRGYRWVPHLWVREGRGWRLREGHWARR